FRSGRDSIAAHASADRAGNFVGSLVPLSGNLATALHDVAGQFELVVVAGAADGQHKAVVALAMGVASAAAQLLMDFARQIDGAAAGPIAGNRRERMDGRRL